MREKTDDDRPGLLSSLPTDELKDGAQKLLGAYADRAADRMQNRMGHLSERLTDYAENGGGPGLKAAISGGKALAEDKSPGKGILASAATGIKEKAKQVFGQGKGGGGKKIKVTNIVESIDVGAPIEVVYNQWTQFQDFPSFMKKVESADQTEETKVAWKAQVFWSHRTWDSTIIDQRPDRHIVWRSSGQKGHVDGAVTFHELAPNLTRVVLILEYHPQGLFERTGNLWRAQGRRARLELKHFARHVMTQSMLHPEEIEGWRGRIRDSEVVEDEGDEESGESGEGEREESGEDAGEQDYAEDEGDEAETDLGEEGEDEGEDEDEGEEEEYDEDYDDEYDEENGEDDEDDEDEDNGEDEESVSDRRRR